MSDVSWLGPDARRVLRRTPVAQWSALALVIDGETGSRVMSRGELVAMLRSGDLHDLAREAETRRVPPGALLVLGISQADGPILRVLFDDKKGTKR